MSRRAVGWALLIARGGVVGNAAVRETSSRPSADPAVELVSTIVFEHGEPASLHWESTEGTLYIADNENHRIWTWTDAGGLRLAATLPDPDRSLEAKATLVGGIVRLGDGTLVVNRFGKPGGGYGAIAFLNPTTGRGGTVPDLEPTRKRIGLALAPDRRLYGSYFSAVAGGAQAGAVTRIDLARGETDHATGFRKITGLVVVGDTLLVADQLADAIYEVALDPRELALETRELALDAAPSAAARYAVRARLPRPDQLAAGQDESVFTGQFQAAPGSTASLAVRQVLPDGTVRIVAQDPDVSRPSGVAYDPMRRRLFVANGGNPARRFVRVFAIP